ncbi:TIGR02452 family protein [Nonomuraea sp. NPDC050663]|uniref:TIGR02452 family protein n=1 Tax=Nonomuraea sp. NPDC050663 TaxID=3364370 RepID=UPI0037967A48
MREHWRAVAADTMEILSRGWYDSPSGTRVAVAGALREVAVHGPDERLRRPGERGKTTIEVVERSTLAAARGMRAPVVLNFASARSPGGGFLKGAQAQEESLARASSLYLSLREARAFYAAHPRGSSLLYTDAVAYSPDVRVFKDDEGRLLAEPYRMAVITSAAPNTRKLTGRELARVQETLARRGRRVLEVAAAYGHDELVLGAWGCGVFGNDPGVVAACFRELLEGEFGGVFRHVVFAVLGRRTFEVFEETLAA